MTRELRWLASDDADAVVAATDLFDYPVEADWVRRFLDEATHHLCIAYEDGEPAGFVSGVEMTHPDKGTEMFLYELGVDDRFRGRGIGRALVTALADLSEERGAYGMWVLTDADNEAAVRTYRAGGATDADDQLMLGWRFDASHPTFTDP